MYLEDYNYYTAEFQEAASSYFTGKNDTNPELCPKLSRWTVWGMSNVGWRKLLQLPFSSLNRFLKIALRSVMLQRSTTSQWHHNICCCLYWQAMSIRETLQTFSKKMTCGVIWWLTVAAKALNISSQENSESYAFESNKIYDNVENRNKVEECSLGDKHTGNNHSKLQLCIRYRALVGGGSGNCFAVAKPIKNISSS